MRIFLTPQVLPLLRAYVTVAAKISCTYLQTVAFTVGNGESAEFGKNQSIARDSGREYYERCVPLQDGNNSVGA